MQTDFKAEYKTIINASLEKVWDALTHPETIKQYFFGTQLITDWKIGSPVLFQGEWEGKSYNDKGTVLEYIENEKLAYSYLSTWSGKEDQPENYLWVYYEVNRIEDKTELTVQQSNYDQERAIDSVDNWEALIDEMKKLIE